MKEEGGCHEANQWLHGREGNSEIREGGVSRGREGCISIHNKPPPSQETRFATREIKI